MKPVDPPHTAAAGPDLSLTSGETKVVAGLMCLLSALLAGLCLWFLSEEHRSVWPGLAVIAPTFLLLLPTPTLRALIVVIVVQIVLSGGLGLYFILSGGGWLLSSFVCLASLPIQAKFLVYWKKRETSVEGAEKR